MKSGIIVCGLAAASLLCGCNAENAQITKFSPGAGPSDGAAPQGGVAVTRNAHNGSRFGEDETTVVFSLVANDLRGTPANQAGLAFLPSTNAQLRPFTFHFNPAAPGFRTRSFITTSRGVLFAARSGFNESLISLVDPATRQTSEVARVSQANIISLSASDDLSLVAWTDSTGGASLQRDSKSVKVGGSELRYDDVQISRDALTLLVSGRDRNGAPAFNIVALEGQSPAVAPIVAGLGARLSPDGTRVAFISADSGHASLMLYDRARGAAAAAATFQDTASAGELAWKNGSELTLRVTGTDGVSRLESYDLDSGATTLIAKLELPAALGDEQVVCPAWADASTVYFSDLRGGAYSVSRARLVDGAWVVESFASPPGEGYSLICPQLFVRRSA